jgi:tRNA (cytidine32/uridine32-2'-O)-methyltransferase
MNHADDPTCRIRFVLTRTSHPGNIGSAARAIRTMGFHRLALVAPQRFPHADAVALAAGATDVLDQASLAGDLGQALGDCALVLGATARHRGVALPELDPRAAAARALEVAATGGEVAVVFGNERAGLDNQELARCDAALVIPSDPTFPSLNLAQAVQLVAWELRMATSGTASLPRSSPGDPPASSAQMESFFAHLAQLLDDIDFHKGRSPRTIMLRLRGLFLRMRPNQRELRILRGIFSDTRRRLRAAPARPTLNADDAGNPVPRGQTRTGPR